MRGGHAVEVDELGYLLSAVAAWGRHGIYPPPLAGDADDPATVERVKAIRARWAAMSEEERVAHRRAAEAFLAEWDREHGWVDDKPPA